MLCYGLLCLTCFHFELGSSVALMRPIATTVASGSVSSLVIALARDLRINHPGIPDLGHNEICPLTDISGIQLQPTVVGLWNFVCWLGFLRGLSRISKIGMGFLCLPSPVGRCKNWVPSKSKNQLMAKVIQNVGWNHHWVNSWYKMVLKIVP